MSLALWFDFWDEAIDWIPGPPPPPPPAQPTGQPLPGPSENSAGSGGKHLDDSDPFPVDISDVREAYLRSLFEQVRALQPDKPTPPPVEDDEPDESPARKLANFFPKYTAELGEAVNALRLAESASELQKQGTRVAELVAGYAAAKRAVEEDLAKRETAYRIRQAERLAKKQAAITAAKLLLRAIKGN
jgi:hypothetical protein